MTPPKLLFIYYSYTILSLEFRTKIYFAWKKLCKEIITPNKTTLAIYCDNHVS